MAEKLALEADSALALFPIGWDNLQVTLSWWFGYVWIGGRAI